MRKFYRIAALAFAGAFFVVSVFSGTAEAVQQELRIGYNEKPVSAEPVDGARDLNQDYMRILASYAGMKAVFVPGTGSGGNLARLQAGEIDVLMNVTDLPYRHAFLDYGRIPMSMSKSTLYLRGGVSMFDRADRETPLAIGILHNQFTSPYLGPVLAQEGFSYTFQEYENRKELAAAYAAGQIDGCALDTDMPESLQPAAALQADPVYFAVKKGNTKLLEKLNAAASRLATARPMLFADIYNLYHTGRSSEPLLLDQHERVYLEEHPVLRCAVIVGERPYSYIDAQGRLAGGLGAVADRISADLGISVEAVPVTSAEEAYEHLADSTADVMLDSRWSPGWAGAHGYKQTAPYMTSYFTEVTRRDGKPEHPVAAYWSKRLGEAALSQRFDEAHMQHYDSMAEALSAVADGKADVAYLRQEVAQYETFAGRFPSLVANGSVAFTTRTAITMREEADPALLSLLDKEIAHMGQNVADGAIAEERQAFLQNQSLRSYFYNYPQYFFFGAFFVALGIALSFYRYRRMKKRNMKELQETIDTDLATGLHNLAWLERIGAPVAEAGRGGKEPHLAAVAVRALRPDIIAGTYGRDVLAELCRSLGQDLADEPWVIHAGTRAASAEVFALARAEEKELAAALRKALRSHETQKVGQMLVRIPMEAGICYLGDPPMELRTAMNNAELAAHGAHPVGIFNSALQRETLLMSRMESIQEDALARREFHVWYQPKYNLKTKKCIGAEALVRWESSELGFLSPGKFIPLFESNGFITQLDFYNLEHVMEFQREAPAKGLPVLPISVNQSRQHMREEDYLQHVQALVDAYGTEGIELELTETAFDVLGEAMRAHSLDVVTSLHGMGFAIDMDDFGSGYSDLALLNQLPLDVMKIDRSLLLASEGSDRMRIVLAQMIALGHALGMHVICEGIETEEQEQMLIACGCEYGQGYLYGKPMRHADYEAFLRVHA